MPLIKHVGTGELVSCEGQGFDDRMRSGAWVVVDPSPAAVAVDVQVESLPGGGD